MNQKTLTTIGLGILAVIGFLTLALESGVLPWAIILGLLTSAVMLLWLREWKSACLAGGGVAFVIVSFGILALLSPGWYRDLM